MQATFFLGGVFPPPAAGAEILAGTDGAGAGRTADADEPFVGQRIVRDVVCVDIGPDLVETPVEKRVVFEELSDY